MLPGKNVTEEDLEETEARLLESYRGLKQALTNIPSDAARPVADTVKAHPYATVAAAAGAGYMAFRLLELLLPRTKVISREMPEIEERKATKRSRLYRLISGAAAMAMPYVTGYVRGEVSRLLFRHPESEAIIEEPEEEV